MWALATATLVTTGWFVATDRTAPFSCELVCFSAGLLFALPAMRGLLPAAPAAGLFYDITNVGVQLWMMTIAILLQLGRALFFIVFRQQPAAAADAARHAPDACVA